MSTVASAMFVVTQDDIRRSGATNIPDVLRMVPGLDVAQINANTWAISARGFNHQFSDKLLVLIDGRSVLTMIYAGVFWDTQDVPLEDIDRIEVIRGPGATMWGSNAVNGVINIITKPAAETQGGMVTAAGGGHHQAFGTAQYGGTAGRNTSYRIFSKYLNQDHSLGLGDQDAGDAWHLLHGGFRVDQRLSEKDALTTEGDLYTGSEGAIIGHIVSVSPPVFENVPRKAALSGGEILTRWNHVFSARSDTTLAFFVDRYTRSGPELREVALNLDFDFQHHWQFGVRHDLIWGTAYRRRSDDTEGTIDLAFLPTDRVTHLASAFAQDEITLKPDRLSLTTGVKLEYNTLGGFQVQPSARLAWTLSSHHTLWAAFSSAGGTVSRRNADSDINLTVFDNGGTPTVPTLFGNPHEKPEGLVSWELGYRAQPSKRLSLDIATFFNSYRNVASKEFGTPYTASALAPNYLVIPITWGNKVHGNSTGVEVSANWQVLPHWSLSPGYSLLELHLRTDSASTDTITVANSEGSNPRHQAQLRSHVDFRHGLAWDASGYFVSALPVQPVPSYTRLDTQFTWAAGERWSLAVVGQNLLRDHHVESNDGFTSVNSAQIRRSAYAKLTAWF